MRAARLGNERGRPIFRRSPLEFTLQRVRPQREQARDYVKLRIKTLCKLS